MLDVWRRELQKQQKRLKPFEAFHLPNRSWGQLGPLVPLGQLQLTLEISTLSPHLRPTLS